MVTIRAAQTAQQWRNGEHLGPPTKSGFGPPKLDFTKGRERHAPAAELKSSITRHVRCVTTEILNATVDHAVLLVASGGSHIEHIM
ncbi:hypothetical protein TNCV_4848001 [Trichonephila clavipes]|nr:hypothetical protein TNCV_4848001 [Trichonephila clavipes]